MVGSHHPRLRAVDSLGHGVGQVNVRIYITSVYDSYSNSMFDSRRGLSESIISEKDNAAVGTVARGRLSSWASDHFVVRFVGDLPQSPYRHVGATQPPCSLSTLPPHTVPKSPPPLNSLSIPSVVLFPYSTRLRSLSTLLFLSMSL